MLLPALHAAQDEFGWLPGEVMDAVAEYIEIHPAQVREVASFYTMYNLKPVGKYNLKICTNVSCALRGAEDLVEYCEERMGIKCGQTTPDMKFTVEKEECLGACGTAPVMWLNKEYHENLDVPKMQEILDGLERESAGE